MLLLYSCLACSPIFATFLYPLYPIPPAPCSSYRIQVHKHRDGKSDKQTLPRLAFSRLDCNLLISEGGGLGRWADGQKGGSFLFRLPAIRTEDAICIGPLPSLRPPPCLLFVQSSEHTNNKPLKNIAFTAHIHGRTRGAGSTQKKSLP